eukprot:CAMPEP_0184861948 /NCGR_PEP_ID=MMETSP0580-20130426/6517_1 /TAXON_ID=1118495 /ORGANISM="Dactyliosolen fragilissimus" /LENGTH=739 /DNA_ID=CAMNT_0027359631 /DNA_START=203 /DNA_END=2422 /DNA_ORIENTATION=+
MTLTYEKENFNSQEHLSLARKRLSSLGIEPVGNKSMGIRISPVKILNHNDEGDCDALMQSNPNSSNKQANSLRSDANESKLLSMLGFGSGTNGSMKYGSLNQQDAISPRMKEKKMRRKLNWRVGSLQKKSKKPIAPKPKLTSEASGDADTVTGKSVKSFHTFHSTATEQVGNKRGSNQDQQFNTDAMRYSQEQADFTSGYGTISNSSGMISGYNYNPDSHILPKGPPISPTGTETTAELSPSSSPEDDIFRTPKHDERKKLPPRIPLSSKSLNHSPNVDKNALADELETSTDGPLWQLAQLQALSEGPLTPEAHHARVQSPMEDDHDDNERFRVAEINLKAMYALADKHLHHAEFHEALDVFEEILRSQKELHGEEHMRVGVVLYDMANVHMLAKNYSKAAMVCRLSIEILEKGLESLEKNELAESLTLLGSAQLEMNEHKFALENFIRALSIQRVCLDKKDPKLAILLNNIGCCLFQMGDYPSALLFFEEAIDIQRCSNQDDDLLGIAATLSNVGTINLRLKKFDQSVTALKEALLIHETVLGHDNEITNSTRKGLELVHKSFYEHNKNLSKNITRNIVRPKSHLNLMVVDDSDINVKQTCGFPQISKIKDLNELVSDFTNSRFFQKFEEMIGVAGHSKEHEPTSSLEGLKFINQSDKQFEDEDWAQFDVKEFDLGKPSPRQVHTTQPRESIYQGHKQDVRTSSKTLKKEYRSKKKPEDIRKIGNLLDVDTSGDVEWV